MRPDRFLLRVGIPIGLVFCFLAPPWTAGADESTHFARSVDIAHGNLLPGDTPQGTGSEIPLAYRADQDRVSRNYVEGHSPLNATLIGDLLDSTPTWKATVFFDTRPTTASTPVGYLPSALAMLIPNAAGWPGVVVLWAGRVGDLAVYLGLAWLAIRLAVGFRWSIAIGALLPLNLALAASVTPDATTMGALYVVIALWTRVWRAPDRSETPRRLTAMVGAASLLLALSKPPYFLVVAAFPMVWLLARRHDVVARSAAFAASGAALLGLVVTALNSSNNYQAVTETLIDTTVYQPDVQRDRLLGDPLGFLWACVRTGAGEFDDYVQVWTRQLGLWRSDLPILFSWLLLAVVLVAVVRLDRDDLTRLRGRVRAIPVAAAFAFVLLLYGSSYVYFDDSTDYARIGRQMGRYVLPLFAVFVMGWTPRWGPIRDAVGRIPERVVAMALPAVLWVAAFGAAGTWLWWGTAP